MIGEPTSSAVSIATQQIEVSHGYAKNRMDEHPDVHFADDGRWCNVEGRDSGVRPGGANGRSRFRQLAEGIHGS